MRSLDWPVAAVILVGLAVVAALVPDGPEVAGNARIVDGDTLVVGGERVRLAGMDAPELGQSCEGLSGPFRCGVVARDELRARIAGSALSCRGRGRDRYGRLLAVCSVGGDDLGAAMVRAGWAVAFGRYAAEERDAAASRRGLWAGTFDRPQDWRRAHAAEEHPGKP